MTENANGHDREDLILGGHDGDLDPDEVADLPLLAELLGDPSLWAEPREGLEDAVVVHECDSQSRDRGKRLRLRGTVVHQLAKHFGQIDRRHRGHGPGVASTTCLRWRWR